MVTLKTTAVNLVDIKKKFLPLDVMEKLEKRLYKNNRDATGSKIRPHHIEMSQMLWDIVKTRMTSTGYRIEAYKRPVHGRVGTIMGITVKINTELEYGNIHVVHEHQEYVWEGISAEELRYATSSAMASFNTRLNW